MSEFNITVEGGKSVKLPTGGKYCDRDIIVTAEGGGVVENLEEVLAEQRGLIETLQTKLSNKASGGVNFETLSGTVYGDAFMLGDNPDYAYVYIDELFNIRMVAPERGGSVDIKIIKNTFIVSVCDFGLTELPEDELYSRFLDNIIYPHGLRIFIPTENNFNISWA